MTENKKVAMIIGVSNYQNENLHQLDLCKNDGLEMNEVLKKLGYQIKPVNFMVGEIDGLQMRDSIIEFFEDEQIRALDTVLFYFSGHGIPGIDDTYLSSSDIDIAKPHKRGFSFNELMGEMNKCVSKKVITVLDCCYSGNASVGKGTTDTTTLGAKAMEKSSAIIEGYGKCILAASQSYQEAFIANERGHSLFTYHLLEGFKGKKDSVNGNGNITPETLGNYVYVNVTAENPNQKPIIKTSGAGEIILASYPEIADSPINDIKDVNTLLGKAWEAVLLDQFDEAKGYVDRALCLEQENPKVWRILGRLKDKMNDREGAISCYDQAVKLEPTSALTWYNKGTVFLKSENYEGAIQCYEKSISCNMNDADLWHNMAIAYSKLKKSDDAKKCYKKIKELTKN